MGKVYLIFFGPPGSGKGTQIEMISDKLALPLISTGALFRREIKNKTDLGLRVQNIMNGGNLVDDDIVNEIVAKRLSEPELSRGAIFDGYPRNSYQLDFITSKLKQLGQTEKIRIFAILIDVSDDVVRERLGGRLTCTCGATYHKKNNPPKVTGICDDCGAKLYLRDDDKPEVINKRLEIYHKSIETILDYYRKQNKLITVAGEQEIEKVTAALSNEIKQAGIVI